MREEIKNWLRINWFRVSILVILLFVVGNSFYWFEWRPARIRHNCSWIERHSDAEPKITQEQYNKCEENYLGSTWKGKYLCDKPHPFVPAKDWLGKANKDEYNFCLHDKGL